MTDEAQPGIKSSARGEAAWKEERERIAERNQAARKAGRARREAYDEARERARRDAERERDAGLIGKRRG